MTVIETALARGDIDAVRDEAERLKVNRIRAIELELAEDEQVHRVIEFIGRTNPAAIDAMIAGQS